MEDHDDSAESLEFFLKGAGYHVVLAKTALEARKFFDRSFHLIVSDLGLPDLNGWDLVKHLRRVNPVPAIAAIASVVRADPLRLEQVFWNLLDNAAKFSPKSSEIHLKTWNEGDRIWISILDSGIGFEGDPLELFKPFKQMNQEFGGLGMGLALAKNFVESQEGIIELRSAGAGRGSEALLSFPLAGKDTVRVEV